MKKKKFPKYFSANLIRQYGEQTYRDSLRTGQSNKDAAWASVYVAEACGHIKQADIKKFHAAIVKYATNTIFPENFI